ncbi:MAG: hypothetical protein ACTTHG_07155 [Treponemataceae bacterium]
MSKESWLAQEIYSRYGEVKRARGCFLYTEKGVRLTDMFQENGRAILGWEGGKARLVFKNILEKGQVGFFKTHFSAAFEKAVLEFFIGFDVVLLVKESDVVQKKIPRWFPFYDDTGSPYNTLDEDVFYFIPPFPFSCDIAIVVAKNNSLIKSFELFEYQIISPSLQAAFTRCIYDLKAAIQNRCEKDFSLYDSVLKKYFERKGAFLYPNKKIIAGQNYEHFVTFCLDNTIVISPDIKNPSIIPFGADAGVFRKLDRADFSM